MFAKSRETSLYFKVSPFDIATAWGLRLKFFETGSEGLRPVIKGNIIFKGIDFRKTSVGKKK